MYYIQLFSDTYTPFAKMIEVDSVLLPRPGDMIEHSEFKDIDFMVFDVSHCLFDGNCMVIVRAREASREDRHILLMETGYVIPKEESRHGELFLSSQAWNAALSNLPKYREFEG